MAIDSFRGEYRWLSNFWPAVVNYEGIDYPTVEHAFQAAKTLNLTDREIITKAPTPGIAKRLGRKVTLRKDWNEVKLDIMRLLLEQKFAHKDLRDSLIATGNQELIEGNSWNDTYWGVCNRKGYNHLGNILMNIRELLTT